ncbi:MAG: ribose 5-phosphate isomerase B, partial [Calditrichaeota bacterium]
KLLDIDFNDKTIFLGGDHSITYASFKSFMKSIPGKNALVIFDAHPDVFQEFDEPRHGDYLKFLIDEGYEVEDVGTFSTESVDYPDFAHQVAQKVARGEGWRGVIVDGAGVGSAMVANKVPGIRAASCQDVYTARNSRQHNDANILTLGSRVLGVDVAKEILLVWLQTDFGGGRHKRRVDKIIEIEKRYCK